MYASHQHQEGLAHLLYGIQVGGGFVALTGEVGTGKTLLCHCLLQQLPATVDMALILNPRLDAIELLASICDELGIQYPPALSLKSLVDALNKHLLSAHAKGRKTVVMIDEAQNLSLDVLEQIRLLTNLETTTDKLLQIILVGQPELQTLLNRPALRQLSQRITARYHLKELDFSETVTYIQHRLSICSGDPALFKASALRQIFKLSGGIPRLINRLCDRALLGAYARGFTQVDVKIVNNSAKETGLLIPPKRKTPKPEWQGKLLLLGLGVSLLIGGLFALKRFEAMPPVPQPVTAAVVQPPPVQALPVQQVSVVESLSNQQHILLSDALGNALKLFSKTNPSQKPLDCNTIEQLGLACFMDKSTWGKVIALNRPVILELELAPKQKSFALLTGLSGWNALLTVDKEISVPIATLMEYWKGYYLMVWEPPMRGFKALAPMQKHAAIGWMRQQLGVPARAPERTSFFDQTLMHAVITFQRQQQLPGTGVVGVRTFIHLQNLQQAGRYPKLNLRD
ncbi:MAG: AAA family ATPase [Methylococcales bacterium]